MMRKYGTPSENINEKKRFLCKKCYIPYLGGQLDLKAIGSRSILPAWIRSVWVAEWLPDHEALRFEFHWKWNSAHDSMVLCCT